MRIWTAHWGHKCTDLIRTLRPKMYGFDPYIRTMYGPDIPYNPYIVATLYTWSTKVYISVLDKALQPGWTMTCTSVAYPFLSYNKSTNV